MIDTPIPLIYTLDVCAYQPVPVNAQTLLSSYCACQWPQTFSQSFFFFRITRCRHHDLSTPNKEQVCQCLLIHTAFLLLLYSDLERFRDWSAHSLY